MIAIPIPPAPAPLGDVLRAASLMSRSSWIGLASMPNAPGGYHCSVRSTPYRVGKVISLPGHAACTESPTPYILPPGLCDRRELVFAVYHSTATFVCWSWLTAPERTEIRNQARESEWHCCPKRTCSVTHWAFIWEPNFTKFRRPRRSLSLLTHSRPDQRGQFRTGVLPSTEELPILGSNNIIVITVYLGSNNNIIIIPGGSDSNNIIGTLKISIATVTTVTTTGSGPDRAVEDLS